MPQKIRLAGRASTPLPPLVDALVHDIFSRLSLREKFRARRVSVAWNNSLASAGLFTTVDVSSTSDDGRVTGAALRSIFADATEAEELDVSFAVLPFVSELQDAVAPTPHELPLNTTDVLEARTQPSVVLFFLWPRTGAGFLRASALQLTRRLQAVKASARTLRVRHRRTLHVIGQDDTKCPDSRTVYSVGQVAAILAAAPLLRELTTSVICTPAESRAVLRNEAPYGALRCECLEIEQPNPDYPMPPAVFDVANVVLPVESPYLTIPAEEVVSLAADIGKHTFLRALIVKQAALSSVVPFDALVTGVIGAQLSALDLSFCGLAPQSVPALARLLAGGHLADLALCEEDDPLLDGATEPVFSHALRANRSLLHLALSRVALWDDVTLGDGVVSALVSHPTLRSIDLSTNDAPEGHAEGAANSIRRLISADCPTLVELMISSCALRDASALLAEALHANTHSVSFGCGFQGMTEAGAKAFLAGVRRRSAALKCLELLGEECGDGPQCRALGAANHLVNYGREPSANASE